MAFIIDNEELKSGLILFRRGDVAHAQARRPARRRKRVLEQAREIDTRKAAQAEVERLRAIIEALQRHQFGRRSEQLDPDQLQHGLEDVETALAQVEAANEAKTGRARGDRPRKKLSMSGCDSGFQHHALVD